MQKYDLGIISRGSMHTIRLKLKTTAYEEQILEKRFQAMWHIHNTLVKHARKLLVKLDHDKEYQAWKEDYVLLLKKKENLSKPEKLCKKELLYRMNDKRKSYGLTEYGLQAYLAVCGKQYRHLVSSSQVQKEATRVYRGVEKILFSEGKELHFIKKSDLTTIAGKSKTNGVKFNKEMLSIEWLGLSLKCKLPKKDNTLDYIKEALKDDISYCEIKRLMFPNGWQYYVIVYLKGDAPKKLQRQGDTDSVTGIDIGTSTIATVSDKEVQLLELAPRCKNYNKRIQTLQYHMDLSKRAMNPNKYKADGTIDKRNREPWVFSHTYLKHRRKLQSLYRQKAAYIKQSHEERINHLLQDSVCFVVEDMSFRGLQRRVKMTERSNKLSEVKQKNGSIKKVYKYKRKKRFGKSLNNRAPALFLSLLEQKATLYGGSLVKVTTKSFRASQYNHVTDTYEPYTLSNRIKLIDGHPIQRDLYSAFLLKNTNQALDKPDRENCISTFENFVKLHNTTIQQMKENHISMKQCFGF